MSVLFVIAIVADRRAEPKTADSRNPSTPLPLRMHNLSSFLEKLQKQTEMLQSLKSSSV